MSDVLKHRMQTFEEAPPDTVWQNINDQLEGVNQELPLAKKMFEHQETPPDISWDLISSALEKEANTNLSDRILAYEVTPPVSAWTNISAVIMEETNDLADRILAFEVTPPSSAWDNIYTAIEQQSPAENIKPAPVRKFQPWTRRFAVAAAIGGLLFWGIYYMNNKVAVVDGLATTLNNNTLGAPQKDSAPAGITPTLNQQTEKHSPVAETIVTPSSTEIPGAGRPDRRLIKYASVSAKTLAHERNFIINTSPIDDKRLQQLTSRANHNPGYVSIITPDGSTIQVSAKFAEAVRYLYSTGEGADAAEWSKRIKEWNSKLSKSSFVPASSNLLGIIELGELISNNQ